MEEDLLEEDDEMEDVDKAEEEKMKKHGTTVIIRITPALRESLKGMKDKKKKRGMSKNDLFSIVEDKLDISPDLMNEDHG